jgi:hypothetical protein
MPENTSPFCDIRNEFDRILVVNPLKTLWSYQFSLEAAMQSKSDQNEVLWINASPNFRSGSLINKKQFISKVRFKSPYKRASSVLRKRSILTSDLKLSNFFLKKEMKFTSIQDMLNFKYREVNLGAAVYSAVTSKYKTTGFDLEEVRTDLNYFSSYAFRLSDQLIEAIDEFKPDLIITTNDRLMAASISLDLARSLNIATRVIYYGSEPTSFQIYEKSLYDSREWSLHVSNKFKNQPPNKDDLYEIKAEIINLVKTPTEDSQEFTKNQIKGKGISSQGKTCVFYAQSEYEHSPHIASRISGRFPNQYVAFKELMKICQEFDYQLILKHHPIREFTPSRKEFRNQTSDWNQIEIEDWVIQIPPDSDIDTYELILNSDINVVWTSTVGIESILRERPTVVLGDTHWLNLDFGIHAWDAVQLRNFFLYPNKLISKESLIPWFWFLSNYGSSLEIVKMENGNLFVDEIPLLQLRAVLRLLAPIKRFFQELKHLFDKHH